MENYSLNFFIMEITCCSFFIKNQVLESTIWPILSLSRPDKLLILYMIATINIIMHVFGNPIQYGLLRGCSRMGGARAPLPKICHTYPIMMNDIAQLYLTQRRSKKYLNHMAHPLSSADISIFYRKSANFAISRNTDIDFILIHNFYLF